MRAFEKVMRQEAIEFGEWLLTQGCILSGADDAWKFAAGIGQDTQVYDTKEGDWLTMELLYDKWTTKDNESK